jgi:FkbM family methyltransferase
MSFLQLLPPSTRRAAKRWLGFELGAKTDICVPREMHGRDDGVWCVCPRGLCRDSIIYSFGIGTDISFDVSLIETYGLSVFAFDPTPKSLSWLTTQHVPLEMRVIPCGLADYDGVARFNPPINPQNVSHTMLERPQTAAEAVEVPVRRLESIMTELGHAAIDLLKMDIEGAEYDVLDDMIQSDIRPRQLLVEFHHRFPGAGGVRRTQAAMRQLRSAGYKLFHVSQTQMEFSFILPETNL